MVSRDATRSGSRRWRLLASLLPVLLALGRAGAVAGQTGVIAGQISDVVTGRGISTADVRILDADGRIIASTISDLRGAFMLRGLPRGEYTLAVLAFGYIDRPAIRVQVTPGISELVTIALDPAPLPVTAVVVSVSRREEKVLDAPAVVRVVEQREIAARPGLAPTDQLRDAGADLVRSGLVQANLVTRGFTNVFSGRVLLLTDYRYAEVPSLALNAYHFLPLIDDDLDRIELVHGPASAVYGPNTALGVLHLVTRSPFDSPGTSISLMSGLRAAAAPARRAGLGPIDADRGVGELTFRHAGVLSQRWAWKVSGRFMRGGDWPGYDPVEDSLRARALNGGADAATVSIGRRSFDIERWSGDARVDYRPGEDTEIIASAGMNETSSLGMTTLGFSQVDHWRYAYYQIRARRGRLFAQSFLNTSAAGGTYNLRTGAPTVDDSRIMAAQVQHTMEPAAWERITWGVDLRRTVPRTSGTINGRNEDDDFVNEAGAYAVAETRIGSRFVAGTALRVDHHNRLEDPIYSVRTGLTMRAGNAHSVRLMFHRAFEAPVPVNLFLDLVTADLGAFRLRALGVPADGMPFRRD